MLFTITAGEKRQVLHNSSSVGSSRGRVLGFEAHRGQYDMSLAMALALRLKSLALALASDYVSLTPTLLDCWDTDHLYSR